MPGRLPDGKCPENTNNARLAALEEVAYAAKRVIQSQDASAKNKDDASRKVAADYLRRLKEKLVALDQVSGTGSLFETTDKRHS